MQKLLNLDKIQHVYFVGIAGVGMSSLAQYLKAMGKKVSGSDRSFNYNQSNQIKIKLQKQGIECYLQDGLSNVQGVDLVVVSTAVDSKVNQIQRFNALKKLIIHRSDLLQIITNMKKTISVGGTSGKSTTAAMIFHVLQQSQISPSLITGAGLTSLINKGKIGNCVYRKSEWLVIEADQSDGSIIKYKNEVGILLNISKDHKQVVELQTIFKQFLNNSKINVLNNFLQQQTLETPHFTVSIEGNKYQFFGQNFKQQNLSTKFTVNGTEFNLKLIGKHNMQNALAVIATASAVFNIQLSKISMALQTYEGIFRRSQIKGYQKGITVIDDFAHNPAKCSSMIKAAQKQCLKLIAWYQPHGYHPTKFMFQQFIQKFQQILRQNDELWINQIYNAPGSDVIKTISSIQIVDKLKLKRNNYYYLQDRTQLFQKIVDRLTEGTIVLLMGGRDPTLSEFSDYIFNKL